MVIVSAVTPHTGSEPPYTVEKQTHAVAFRPDGTAGGEYTVHIRHRNGVRTKFTVPEEHYTAPTVHGIAMGQVETVRQVEQLPDSVTRPSTTTQAQ